MDRSMFLECYMQVETALRAYFLGVTGNYHDAEDMLQRVWQVLWEKWDQYDPPAPSRGGPSAWPGWKC